MRYLIKELAFLFLLFVPLLLYAHTKDRVNSFSSSIHNDEISNRCSRQFQIADVYFHLKDYDNALLALSKGSSHCNNTIDSFIINYTISQVYLRKGMPEKALSCLIKLQKDCISNSDTIGIIQTFYGLGNYYLSVNNIPKSTSHYDQALTLLKQQHNVELETLVLLGLAKLYMGVGNFSDAKSYAQKALKNIGNSSNKLLKADCFQFFSQFYENLGNYKSAYYYKTKYILLKDSISSTQLLDVLSGVGRMDDLQEDKQVIELLEKENHSLNTYWLKEKNKGYLFLIISVLLFAFTVILFFLFRSKITVSRALKSKNLELQKLNATKDKFFSIIAHDLKSPFNSLMGFSEVLSLHAETKSYDDIMEYSKIIHHSTRKLFSLVETLLHWSRTQLGTTEYKPEKLDVKFVSGNIVSILKINAEEKDIVISVDIDSEVIAWADKDLYSAVLRNLLSNAIKFSRVGSVVNVACTVKNKEVIISVTDSGVGISNENLDKIFRVDANVSTEGTFNEKGTGLGLVLCKEFVEINRGTIWVESQLEKGSVFKFTMPLYVVDR